MAEHSQGAEHSYNAHCGLKTATRKGVVSEQREGGFPRYVWYKDGETVYEARLVNRGSGEYKGFPLRLDEWPRGIEGYYD